MEWLCIVFYFSSSNSMAKMISWKTRCYLRNHLSSFLSFLTKDRKMTLSGFLQRYLYASLIQAEDNDDDEASQLHAESRSCSS